MKNYVLFMVLAELLFASACSEPMDTTVAHYEPTEKNQADFAELEQRLADVNAAVAELTDETGCVAPENHEAALAAAEAYGKAAVDSGALLSCVREEGSVLFTLNSGYGVAYIPRLKGMLAGGGESSIVTFEPYKQDFAYSIAAGAGDFFTVSYYAEQMSKNKDLDAWRYDGIAANGNVTVAAAKNFKPGSCIFWQSHGGYLTPYGPIIFLGEKADLASTGYYAEDLLGKRLIVGADGHYGVTAAFFETYYEDGALADCVFYLGACSTMEDTDLGYTLMKKGADLVLGSTQSISIAYNAQIMTEVMDRLNDTQGGASPSFADALQGAKEKHGEIDSLFGLPYSPAQVVFMGDGDYSLTDPDHTYDAVSRREISVMDNNVLSTYMEVQGEADGYRYAVVDGQAVLLSYNGAETSLSLPERIAGYPVAAVGQKCFKGNQALNEVFIPDTYQAIHPYAFYECRNLRTVTLGLGIQSIDRFAFAGSGVSLFRVYQDSLGEFFCHALGYPSRVTQVEYISWQSVGNVVGTEETVYYWRYGKQSLAASGVLGWYPPVVGAQNQLVRRNADGTETVLFEAAGAGEIALAGDRIFFESPTNEFGGTDICSCALDGGDLVNYGPGDLLAVMNGGTTVLCSESYDEQLERINVLSGERTLLAVGRYLAQHDGLIYYQPPLEDRGAAMAGSATLSVIRPDGSGQQDLCTTAPDLYNDTMQSEAFITHLVVTDQKIYFAYGSVGGTGLVYQGGKVMALNKDGSDAHVAAGGDGLKEAGFTVNEDGSVTAKDVGEWKLFFDPLEKTCVGEGAIYIFDPDTGAPECVMLPEEYGAAGEGLCEHSGSTLLNLEFAERIGKMVYCEFSYGTENPQGSIGWRTSYLRKKTTLLLKDLESGSVTVLFSE